MADVPERPAMLTYVGRDNASVNHHAWCRTLETVIIKSLHYSKSGISIGDGSMKILYQGGNGEITEKKSRFIATLQPVHSEEEAVQWFGEMKKQYWDARHNCTAFVIGYDNTLMRCSDDGEPAGTAGRPMLDVLNGLDLRNAAVVVTRYFGGVLLGTGGLVRAYQSAVQEGLKNCVILDRLLGYPLVIRSNYNDWGKLEYLIRQHGYYLEDTEYAADVTVHLMVPTTDRGQIQTQIADATAGRASLTWGDEKAYGVYKGKMIYF